MQQSYQQFLFKLSRSVPHHLGLKLFSTVISGDEEEKLEKPVLRLVKRIPENRQENGLIWSSFYGFFFW